MSTRLSSSTPAVSTPPPPPPIQPRSSPSPSLIPLPSPSRSPSASPVRATAHKSSSIPLPTRSHSTLRTPSPSPSRTTPSLSPDSPYSKAERSSPEQPLRPRSSLSFTSTTSFVSPHSPSRRDRTISRASLSPRQRTSSNPSAHPDTPLGPLRLKPSSSFDSLRLTPSPSPSATSSGRPHKSVKHRKGSKLPVLVGSSSPSLNVPSRPSTPPTPLALFPESGEDKEKRGMTKKKSGATHALHHSASSLAELRKKVNDQRISEGLDPLDPEEGIGRRAPSPAGSGGSAEKAKKKKKKAKKAAGAASGINGEGEEEETDESGANTPLRSETPDVPKSLEDGRPEPSLQTAPPTEPAVAAPSMAEEVAPVPATSQTEMQRQETEVLGSDEPKTAGEVIKTSDTTANGQNIEPLPNHDDNAAPSAEQPSASAQTATVAPPTLDEVDASLSADPEPADSADEDGRGKADTAPWPQRRLSFDSAIVASARASPRVGGSRPLSSSPGLPGPELVQESFTSGTVSPAATNANDASAAVNGASSALELELEDEVNDDREAVMSFDGPVGEVRRSSVTVTDGMSPRAIAARQIVRESTLSRMSSEASLLEDPKSPLYKMKFEEDQLRAAEEEELRQRRAQEAEGKAEEAEGNTSAQGGTAAKAEAQEPPKATSGEDDRIRKELEGAVQRSEEDAKRPKLEEGAPEAAINESESSSSSKRDRDGPDGAADQREIDDPFAWARAERSLSSSGGGDATKSSAAAGHDVVSKLKDKLEPSQPETVRSASAGAPRVVPRSTSHTGRSEDEEEDSRVDPSSSLTLSIFSPGLSLSRRMGLAMSSVTINLLLPFVNGVMLGFGEIFARVVLAPWVGLGRGGAGGTRGERTSTSTASLRGGALGMRAAGRREDGERRE